MNFYYGLVDEATNAWGFVEETDPRVHEGMIYLTAEEWMNLLNGQSEGQQIVYYDGQVFLAEPGKYYLDDDGWHMKSDDDFNQEKANQKREYLVNKIYEIKAEKAYGGVIINDLLVFETNQTAITNTVASLALMSDQGTASWKFYTKQGVPYVQPITKIQLMYIAQFGQNMINQCFAIEGTANTQLEAATIENLLDERWVTKFENTVQTQMDAVSNTITVDFNQGE